MPIDPNNPLEITVDLSISNNDFVFVSDVEPVPDMSFFDEIRVFSDYLTGRVEPKSESVKFWSDHVREKSGMSLMNNVDSWMTVINSNVPTKRARIVGGRYGGSVQSYRGLCGRGAEDKNRRRSFL